jgi:transposase-like protein
MLDNFIKHRHGALYDPEAPVVRELRRLGYIDLHTAVDELDDMSVRTGRAHLRYLAALLPDLDRTRLSQAIAAIVCNERLPERDIRLILDGRSLQDPTRRTNEVPVEAIQTVGRMLSQGRGIREAARAARVGKNTVMAIDNYLGLTTAYQDKVLDDAITAVREGWSVRELAAVAGVSKSQAHRLIRKAREVLAEIGEVLV